MIANEKVFHLSSIIGYRMTFKTMKKTYLIVYCKSPTFMHIYIVFFFLHTRLIFNEKTCYVLTFRMFGFEQNLCLIDPTGGLVMELSCLVVLMTTG